MSIFLAVQNSSASNFHSVVNQFKPTKQSTRLKHIPLHSTATVSSRTPNQNRKCSPSLSSDKFKYNNLYNTFPARIIAQTFVLVAFRRLLFKRPHLVFKQNISLTFDSIFGQKYIRAFDWSANKPQLGSRHIRGN